MKNNKNSLLLLVKPEQLFILKISHFYSMKYILLSCLAAIGFFLCIAQRPNAGLKRKNNRTMQTADTTVPKINSGKTQFGVLIKPPHPGEGGGTNFKINIAKKLGLNCIRDGISLDNPKDKPIFNAGFKVVLNVNNSSGANKLGAPFVTDTADYKKKLQYQLSLMSNKPVLLVIENEENNQRYHTGAAQDYINQLQAAATVAHANGVAVTNGGITFPAVLYLVYLDYLSQGKTREAADLEQRSSVSFSSKWLTSRKDFLQQLIAGYAKLDIDYVNFHWYGKNGDTKSLEEVVTYLQRVTGKPAISNEIGQQDASPQTVKAILQTCRRLGLRYAIWYSGDGERNTDEQAVGLQNNDGSLREGGDAFKEAVNE